MYMSAMQCTLAPSTPFPPLSLLLPLARACISTSSCLALSSFYSNTLLSLSCKVVHKQKNKKRCAQTNEQKKEKKTRPDIKNKKYVTKTAKITLLQGESKSELEKKKKKTSPTPLTKEEIPQKPVNRQIKRNQA
jgi:hypothetical protein